MNLLESLFRALISVLSKIINLSVHKRVSAITVILQELVLTEKNPLNSLKMLLRLDREIYFLTGQESIRYGNGLHTKHRLTNYHTFFIENINAGDNILDIGCGNGSLSYDIVSNVKNAKLLGIDLNKDYITFAKQNYNHPNLKFAVGNVLTDLPDEKFDVVILSNVLEHLEQRVEILTQLKTKIIPSKYLIRVPLFERDWRVPLMKELGLDYRLSPTHHIEYTQEQFFSELKQAGLMTENYEIRWGEIWAVVKPL